MAAYRRVYDSRHLQADCQGWVPIQRRAFERDAFERESFQLEALQ